MTINLAYFSWGGQAGEKIAGDKMSCLHAFHQLLLCTFQLCELKRGGRGQLWVPWLQPLAAVPPVLRGGQGGEGC